MSDEVIEALAEVWASIDGTLDRFRRCKVDQNFADIDGSYEGYISEAEEAVRRLGTRGFKIVKTAGETKILAFAPVQEEEP